MAKHIPETNEKQKKKKTTSGLNQSISNLTFVRKKNNVMP